MAVSQPNHEGLRRGLQEWSSAAEEAFRMGRRDHWAAAVSRWLVDASLLGDTKSLHEGLETLRVIHGRERGVLSGTAVSVLMEVARAALDRAREAELEETLDPDSFATRLLLFLHEVSGSVTGISTAEVANRLNISVSEFSQSALALRERGLVSNTRHFDGLYWRTTARGARVALSLLHRREEANS